MAFQLVCFKMASCLLNLFGVAKNVANLTPTANNVFEMLFYLVLGVMIPCLLGLFIEKFKKMVVR